MKLTINDVEIAAKRCNEIYRTKGISAYGNAVDEFEYEIKTNKELTDKEKDDLLYWFRRIR